jgi:hypothetical protein
MAMRDDSDGTNDAEDEEEEEEQYNDQLLGNERLVISYIV